MRRRLALLIAIGLLAVACSSADSVSSTTGSQSDQSAPSTTAAAAESPAPSAATTDSTAPSSTEAPAPTPDPNRPLAPDFELTLGTGELYQLSAETKPVYLVFWAEW